MAPQSPAHPLNPVILTGPTSVGKTAVALALAACVPLRIISADSMQVYRGLDIGSAKPSAEEQRQVRHYGLDLADPAAPFSVAEFLAHALPAIRETQEAGELPLIVGGTRLYLHALTGAFDAGPPPDPLVRAALEEEAAAVGLPALHNRLRQVDPTAAERLHPNDQKRIIRALEVYVSTGRPLTAIQQESRQRAPLLQPRCLALVMDRQAIYARVETRTTAMMQAGWVEEVARLVKQGFGPGLEAIRAHGYPELMAYLRGDMIFHEAVAQINRNVRHYVRYQLGWIRHWPEMVTIDAARPLAEQVAAVRAALQDPALP